MTSQGNPAVVAIIGRPNVGKSTLFNRLVGRKLALVDDQPGVTRDRREGEARLMGLGFTVVDTAGLEETGATVLAGRMRAQTEAAIAAADVILFVVDARLGLTPLDQPFADMVRRSGKPVILLANKAEGGKGLSGVYEAFGLGLGEPIPVSAEHGEGMVELFDAIKGHVRRAKRAKQASMGDEPMENAEGAAMHDPARDDEDGEDERPSGLLRVAIIGRPNAGKSTLVNRLIGEDRLLTGPEAGITRDTISLDWAWRGRDIRLHDTAGIRRKARVEAKLEKLSVADALRAVRFAEVVVVLLDATVPFEKQDLTIIDLVEREGRAVIIGLNKWDLVADQNGLLKTLREECARLLPQVKGISVVPLSGLAGNGVEKLMDAVLKAEEVWMKRIPTAGLNRWLESAVQGHTPPAVSGRRIKIRYMTQAKARPPTFILFGNQLDALPKSYTRYLVNGLRESFSLHGTPIRLNLRNSENPYAKKD